MRQSALQKLADIEGMTVNEILENAVYNDDSWGVCTNEGCNYTTPIEPDGRGDTCEHCKTRTVVSACMLAGII